MPTTLEQSIPYVGATEALDGRLNHLRESLATWATCIGRDALSGDPEPCGGYFLERIVAEVSEADRLRAERRRRYTGFWLARPESPYAQTRTVTA